MPTCDCSTFPDLLLERKSITSRAKLQRALSNRLALVSSSPDAEHRLFHCPQCGAHWQGASAWALGAKPYMFRVPDTTAEEWSRERFVDPDEVLVFVALVERFLKAQQFGHAGNVCASQGCGLTAVTLSVFCLRHHVESLQDSKLLPRTPQGKWFGHYLSFRPEHLQRWLAEVQAAGNQFPAG
jgi:hypothetical protein